MKPRFRDITSVFEVQAFGHHTAADLENDLQTKMNAALANELAEKVVFSTAVVLASAQVESEELVQAGCIFFGADPYADIDGIQIPVDGEIGFNLQAKVFIEKGMTIEEALANVSVRSDEWMNENYWLSPIDFDLPVSHEATFGSVEGTEWYAAHILLCTKS